MAARADLPAGVGVCVCFEGRGGEACSEPTGDVYVLPDSKVISASSDNSMKVWDLGRGECLNTLTGHSNTRMLLYKT